MPGVERSGSHWRDPPESDRPDDPPAGNASRSAQPLSLWRGSLVTEFITPHVGVGVTALEVGPGQGEWTERVIGTVQTLIVADRRAETLAAIRARLGPRPDLIAVPIVNHRLSDVPEASVDLAYSFDFFPQVDWWTLAQWLGELSRILRPSGHLVVHHAATPRRLRTVTPPQTGLHASRTSGTGRTSRGGSSGSSRHAPIGSAHSFTVSGLVTTRQTSSWGLAGEFTVDEYRDVITVARKPTGRATSRPG